MNLANELKGIIEININEDVLAKKIFDKGVDPLIQKVLAMIPGGVDDLFYASQKDELEALFSKLIKGGIDKVEDIVDGALDEEKK